MAVSDQRQPGRELHPWLKPVDRLTGSELITYDRLSDTLFVDFYGEGRPAISVPTPDGDRDFLYLRVDPETSEVVGLQIEAYLGYAVRTDPSFWHGILLAELEGLSEIEAIELRQRARASLQDQADAKSFVAGLARRIA